MGSTGFFSSAEGTNCRLPVGDFRFGAATLDMVLPLLSSYRPIGTRPSQIGEHPAPRGRWIAKSEPRPGSLWTVTLPPCSAMMRRGGGRPRPRALRLGDSEERGGGKR